MILEQALARATYRINNTPSARLDAELLAAYCLNKTISQINTHPEIKLTFWQVSRFNYLINLRRRGWPVAYLIKNKEFYDLNFKVNRHVLVPRPDSELLVEQAIKILESNPNIKTIVDLGTGSGCLAIVLAKKYPAKNIIATDLSRRALTVAKLNSLNHQTNNITFYKGDKLKPLKKLISYQINPPYLLLTNPPYLSSKTYSTDLKKEPYLALWGGPDGLDWYQDFFKQLTTWPETFWPNSVIMEISPELAEPIQLFNKQLKINYQVRLLTDLANKNRAILFYK